MGTNLMSGIGCERDRELASAGRGRRNNTRWYNDGVDRERMMFPITLNEKIRHADYLQGDAVSVKDGKIVPLDPALPFAGIIERVGEDRGKYVASVFVRGAVCGRVSGLNSETRQGAKVFARPEGSTQVFSLAEEGVCIGEVCALESVERSMAIVGFRIATDERRFELGGPRPSR